TFFFFFSSRRRHTRFSRDWSSDVCSSDLWQTNLVPQDLDMLRIKIQEELEIPHMQKVQGLQSEIESLRQLTHKIRTEKVWLQTEIGRASCRERVSSAVGDGAEEKIESRRR